MDPTKPEGRKPFLTQEAFTLFTRSGEDDGRYPYRMYLPQDELEAASRELGESITDTELMLLVHDDGVQEICANPKCARKFRPVAGATLRDLSDERVLTQIRSGAGRSAPKADYGQIAPFVATLATGEVMEWGSFVKVPILKNGRLVGWEAKAFCGPIYWFDKSRGVVVWNNNSCLVAAMKASYEAGFGGRSYSRSSVVASIATSEARHRANVEQSQSRTESRSAIGDMFGIRVENTPEGRVFSREDAPKPPTVGDLTVEVRNSRNAKRHGQGGR